MESEADYEKMVLPESESSALDFRPKLKRLKKKETVEGSGSTIRVENESVPIVDDVQGLGLGVDLEKGNESDGFDPLFGEESQGGVKRVLEFDSLEQRFDDSNDGLVEVDDEEEELWGKKDGKKKKKVSSVECEDLNEKKIRSSSNGGFDGNESDGLDPLFGEGDQGGVKRALQFDSLGQGVDGSGNGLVEDVDEEEELWGKKDGKKKKKVSSEECDDLNDKKKTGSSNVGFDGNEPDGLDPLFGEGDQGGVKRALEFDSWGQGVDDSGDRLCGDNDDDDEFQTESNEKKKKRESSEERDIQNEKNKKRKKKASGSNVGPDGKPKPSKQKEKEERNARLAQLADFQRVMRERKDVGFKPVPMVEKPITSVLAKIRQRRMEVSKKAMAFRSLRQEELQTETAVDNVTEITFEVSNSIPETVVDERIAQASCKNDATNSSPVSATSDDEPISSDEKISTPVALTEETKSSFRSAVNDTQDLFPDSQSSDTQSDESNQSSSPAEDVTPSLPSLNLKFDSELPEDISSDEEDSDKENAEPRQQTLLKGDPVKKFVDEEAMEDDSDDDILPSGDEDEGDEDDIEEIHDYIASDFKEKPIDRERCNELHQMWLQQQDEAGTEDLIQRLKYGTKEKELSLLEEEENDINDDDDHHDHDGNESEDEGADDLPPALGARVSTKKLKQMIPQMFTDNDDGFVSSEEEETDNALSKQLLLQKLELKKKSKFLSAVDDETSRQVSRIKKLNTFPEMKKKVKQSSLFDTLLTKGGSSNCSKSSFLRRASSQPVMSSHKNGRNRARSFIFGRDDSNSRSSIAMPEEDSTDTSQKEAQAKRNASAKFVGSQAKWSTQQTKYTTEMVSSTSLFEVLKRSSMQTGQDARDNIVDHESVFAALKSVKKSLKIGGRT